MKKTLSVILALCLLCTMMLCGVSTIASAETETLYTADTAAAKKSGSTLKRTVEGDKVFWYFDDKSGETTYYADLQDNRKMRFYNYTNNSVQRWSITNVDTAALVIPVLLPKNMRFTVQVGVYKDNAASETIFTSADVYVMQEAEGQWQDVVIPLTTFRLRNTTASETLELANVYIRPMDDCTAEERLEYGETLGLSYPSVVNGLTLSAKKASNASWHTDNNSYLTLSSSSFAVKTAVTKDEDRWRFTMRNVLSSAYVIDANKVEEQYLAFRVNVPRDIQLRVRLEEDVNGSTRKSPKDAEVSVNRTLSGDGYQLVSIPLSAFGLTAGTDFVNIKRIFFYPIEAASLEVGETISYGAVEIWDGIPYQFKADIYEKNRYTLTCTDGLSASAVGNLKAGDSVVVTVPSSSYLVAGSLLADYTSAFGEARSQKLFIKGDTPQKGSGSGEQFRFVMPASDVTVSATLCAAANMQAKDSMATLAASVKPENNGLRFLTRVYLEDDKLRVGDALYTIEEMGTQIVPTDLIGADNWSSAVDIPAAILYDKTEKYVDFTGVLSNLKAGNHSREFSARGYVTYNDGTGSVTVYTDTVCATYSALLSM